MWEEAGSNDFLHLNCDQVYSAQSAQKMAYVWDDWCCESQELTLAGLRWTVGIINYKEF